MKICLSNLSFHDTELFIFYIRKYKNVWYRKSQIK